LPLILLSPVYSRPDTPRYGGGLYNERDVLHLERFPR